MLFYLLATTAVGSALLVVTIKNLVRSLFLFFVTLFSVAGLYIFALADFVAITQVIVYVGGVLVLMLFAFMLSNKELLNDLKSGVMGVFSLPNWQGALIAILFFGVLIYMVLLFDKQEPTWITASKDTNGFIQVGDDTIRYLGVNLMTRYVLPFEVVSVFLMMALMGAAHLARKGERRS